MKKYKLRIACIIMIIIMSLSALPVSAAEQSSSEPVPGLKTLKNLLVTALEPAGSTLYVWGGAWENGNAGSGIEAITIGVSPVWRTYFLKNAGVYDYKKHRYESHNGLDCSGFVGWTLYNTMENTNGKKRYVMSSTTMARTFADRGWGTYIASTKIKEYKPGDIVSMSGHVWISMGQCSDGSIVLIHSTPNGGVQLSGTVTSDGKSNSQAYKLADKYMKQYFPYYSNIYATKNCGSSYRNGNLMRWTIGSVLSDPEGIQNMTPEKTLETLFANRPVYKSYIDLIGGQWYINAVTYSINNGLMKGTAPGLFEPDGVVTRAQFAQVLYNRYKAENPASKPSDFNDVKSGAWYYEAVSWASANGFMLGYDNGGFGPDDKLTREQMITVLHRCLDGQKIVDESNLAAYTDSDKISDYAVNAFAWGIASGLINGTSAVELSPKSSCLRTHMAQIMYNLQYAVFPDPLPDTPDPDDDLTDTDTGSTEQDDGLIDPDDLDSGGVIDSDTGQTDPDHGVTGPDTDPTDPDPGLIDDVSR